MAYVNQKGFSLIMGTLLIAANHIAHVHIISKNITTKEKEGNNEQKNSDHISCANLFFCPFLFLPWSRLVKIV